MLNITSNLHYICIQSYADLFNINVNIGTIAYISDTYDMYIRINSNEWQRIGPLSYEESKIEEQPKPRFCSQCGAPLKRYSHKCEYCDTEY